MSSSYFSDAANILMNGMGSNLFDKAGNLISGIAPFFQVGFGLYMVLVAFDYYNRGLDEKAVDLGKRAIGWLIIIACAFNASQYTKIANIAWNLPDNLSGLFGTAQYTASALDTNINNIVETWGKIQAYAAELDWDQISDKLLLYLVGVGIFILGCLFFCCNVCLLFDCQVVISDGDFNWPTVYWFHVVPGYTSMGNELDWSNFKLCVNGYFLHNFRGFAK